MIRRLIVIGLASLIALTGAVSAAQAQSAGARFEITPFVGYRMGGKFDYYDEEGNKERGVDLDSDMSWGFDLGLYRDFNSMFELLYSNQKTSFDSSEPELRSVELTTQYIHIGGTVFYPGQNSYVPYLTGTLGATLFDPTGSYEAESNVS